MALAVRNNMLVPQRGKPFFSDVYFLLLDYVQMVFQTSETSEVVSSRTQIQGAPPSICMGFNNKQKAK